MTRLHANLSIAALVAVLAVPAIAADRPNIVLVMCDDMGYSDLGCYGSEIDTPHIDALAESGLRFSQFRNTGRCCPSRASLMTGRYAHAVGMGWMTAVDEHRPGYRGQLTQSVPTIAEILQAEGYGTYLSGKWHLTIDGGYDAPNGGWPVERGFDHSYGGLTGGGGYWEVKSLVRDRERIDDHFPDDYYYTHAITENAVAYIEQHDTSKPLFLYLAHYAPHRPLEAPADRIEACRERYRVGYDVLRARRYQRMKEAGIVTAERDLPLHTREYPKGRPSWESLGDKRKAAWVTEMATYAAMIEIMDDGIGAVVEALKERDLYDNTVIVFISDNGASREGGLISQLGADLSNTPYRAFKGAVYEGGTASPLVLRLPAGHKVEAGGIRHPPAHIIDIVPTLLELAGVTYPATFNGADIPPPDGVSLVPAFSGDPIPDRPLFFEHQTTRAVADGGWKLVRGRESKEWELIDLGADPFEEADVSGEHPERVTELNGMWDAWAEANGVLPLEKRMWTPRIKHYTALNPDQDGVD